MVPLEERWSARFFEPKDVFYGANNDGAAFYDAKDFHNISSWGNYREYMKSDLAAEIKRPSKELFAYREFNRIAADRD